MSVRMASGTSSLEHMLVDLLECGRGWLMTGPSRWLGRASQTALQGARRRHVTIVHEGPYNNKEKELPALLSDEAHR